MNNSRNIGIIDIGSNSIRLAIYELHETGAYRVIGEFKESARLSQRIGPDGGLPPAEIQNIVRILSNFKRICDAHRVTDYRAAATAAIRNATNAREIADTLSKQSGFHIEILSGEDEARLGFLGMIQTMDISDGFLVDIGGGSTEISLFRNRKLIHSVSFPFGAVNTTRKFAPSGEFQAEQINLIRQMVRQALSEHPWIGQSPGLPLIGLGGGVRTVSKINQRKHKYSLPITHNYVVSPADMDEMSLWLSSLSGERRKKVDGLSKDRYDIIVPGVIILQTIFQTTGAVQYVVSGAGLRDGLFFESFCPADQGQVHIAERSADHFLSLHSTAPKAHITHVNETALKLFDALAQKKLLPHDPKLRLCLSIASKLYRIGASVQYYQFPKHTFHMIAYTRIDGLTHRELLSCALIATYKVKNRIQQAISQHKDIISDTDFEQICKLGTIVRLAIALDASETQALELESLSIEGASIRLYLKRKHDPSAEYREVEGLQKEFKKIWGLQLQFQFQDTSSSRT